VFVFCIGILAPLRVVSSCVTNCHLCFFWLLVFRCVRACVCVCLGLYAILVFPRFFYVVISTVAVSFFATYVLLASRVYVCVRPGRVALWFVIGPCVICLWTCVYDLFRF
jgi:hypothetical protein